MGQLALSKLAASLHTNCPRPSPSKDVGGPHITWFINLTFTAAAVMVRMYCIGDALAYHFRAVPSEQVRARLDDMIAQRTKLSAVTELTQLLSLFETCAYFVCCDSSVDDFVLFWLRSHPLLNTSHAPCIA